MTTATETAIILPDASDLDSCGWREDSGFKLDLYLIPAEENDGQIEVTCHSGIGNIGWPEPAHSRRWLFLGGYSGRAVGQSVLDEIEACADALIDLAGKYQGSKWDGSNRRGSWDVENDYPRLEYSPLGRLDPARPWDAAEWLQGFDWLDISREISVDAYDSEVTDSMVEEVNDWAAGEGAHLSGTREWLESAREEYLEELAERQSED